MTLSRCKFPIIYFLYIYKLLKYHGIYCTWEIAWHTFPILIQLIQCLCCAASFKKPLSGNDKLPHTSTIDLKHRRRGQSVQTPGVFTNKTLSRSVLRVLSVAASHWFRSKLISGWPRSQSPAAAASWWAGPPDWSECRGSSPSSVLCCQQGSGRYLPWSTLRSC